MSRTNMTIFLAAAAVAGLALMAGCRGGGPEPPRELTRVSFSDEGAMLLRSDLYEQNPQADLYLLSEFMPLSPEVRQELAEEIARMVRAREGWSLSDSGRFSYRALVCQFFLDPPPLRPTTGPKAGIYYTYTIRGISSSRLRSAGCQEKSYETDIVVMLDGSRLVPLGIANQRLLD